MQRLLLRSFHLKLLKFGGRFELLKMFKRADVGEMPGAGVTEHVLSMSRALGSIPSPNQLPNKRVVNTSGVTTAFFLLEEASLKTGVRAPPCGVWSECHLLYQQSSTTGGEKVIFKSFYNPVEFLFLIF